jgi:hypothetical protein
METAMTPDEQQLLATLRAWTGGPFLAAMSDDSKRHFENFMASLRIQTAIQ